MISDSNNRFLHIMELSLSLPLVKSYYALLLYVCSIAQLDDAVRIYRGSVASTMLYLFIVGEVCMIQPIDETVLIEAHPVSSAERGEGSVVRSCC